MSKILVLAEKPSVGREIARVLGCKSGGSGYLEGSKYVVTWGLGHLVTLADPEMYDKKYQHWDMADLPMLPEKHKLVVIKETAGQFKTVQAQMKRSDISELVIATDAGREGELVARWIMLKAGWKKPAKRLWISSQTDRAIKEGFANLKPSSDYDALFRAAQARSQADWLVGLNVTRALTCKFNAQLSAGRVQTPTLALIVAREEEIKRFVPKPYWGVSLKLEGFNATWRDKSNSPRILDHNTAEQIAAKVGGKLGVLASVTKTYKQTPPPPAYDLTELQRDANKKFAYSAKETLSIMQSLYEKHKLLTYPRTDSRYISDDVVPTLNERIRSCMTDEYRPIAEKILRNRPLQTKYIVNNSKVSDHHAIIPTEEQPELWRLSGPERNIYDLVVRRFLAVLMPPFEYEEVKLTLMVEGESFSARGKSVKSSGWKDAYNRSYDTLEDDSDEDEKEQLLPNLRQGDKLKILSSKVTKGETAPPRRYTEATLLTAMEHPSSKVGDKALGKILEETSGLGTPATRADIIEKLFSAFYIERQGKELIPTPKGIQLVKIVPEDLRSPELTAVWEDRLSKISKNQEKDSKFIDEMKKYAADLVSQVKASDAVYIHHNQTKEKCPDCGKNLLRVKGKRGESLICPDRECGYRRSLSQTTNARCPNCHKKMELRGEGDKQSFHCVCGYREKLSSFKERRAAAGAGKADIRKYMAQQNRQSEKPSNPMAEQLAKWMAEN